MAAAPAANASPATTSPARAAASAAFDAPPAAGLSLPAESAPRHQELKPFEASYTWTWHGMTVAVSTLRLEHGGGDAIGAGLDAGLDPGGDIWTYRSSSEPRGIGRMFPQRPKQESVLLLSQNGVQPLKYHADDGTSSTKNDADVEFDWIHGRMRGVYEDAKVDMPTAPGVQDDLSVQIAMIVELMRGHTSGKFSMLNKSSVRGYTYALEGEEKQSTPLGVIDTLRFRSQRAYSPRVTRFWCAPSLGFIPMKVEQTRDSDVQWTMRVLSVKR
jgi:hypothetical protein